jgi:hypothetical protein
MHLFLVNAQFLGLQCLNVMLYQLLFDNFSYYLLQFNMGYISFT